MLKKTSGPKGQNTASPGGCIEFSLKGALKLCKEKHVTVNEMAAFMRFREVCDFRMQHLFASKQLNWILEASETRLAPEFEDVIRMNEMHIFLLRVLESRVQHDPSFRFPPGTC